MNTTLLAERRAGVYLHISSLPGNWGIGEIGSEARAFIDAMSQVGLCVWQYLPLGPTAYGDSPYQALSSFAGNELLISIDDLLTARLLRPDETSDLGSLPSDFTDFGALIPIKNTVLNCVAKHFLKRADKSLLTAYENFVTAHNQNWLHDYALYRVLKDMHNLRPWPEWSQSFALRDQQAIAQIEESAVDKINAIKILQFLFYHQWQVLHRYAQDRNVKMFGDMPIYIALDSADAWSHPELLRIDQGGHPESVAGVPPDYFSSDGQLWGNPLYAWGYHRATNYLWWSQRLRWALQFSDIVRIDHFRGFESYWAVPADAATARDGRWETGPGDELFVALKQTLENLPVVAEDLGVITDEVTALRDRHDLPGMEVLQFRVLENGFSVDQISEHCVCYTGTHDNDTTLGWFTGSTDDLRNTEQIEAAQKTVLALTKGTAETVSLDMIQVLFSTPARLCIAPMQDYLSLGSPARMNTPGVSGGNWRWRMQKDQLSEAICDKITALISNTNRHYPHA